MITIIILQLITSVFFGIMAAVTIDEDRSRHCEIKSYIFAIIAGITFIIEKL